MSGRDTRSGVLENFFDVYGANPPSAVANSQWHYGQEVPLYIEDQPLYRGSALWNAVLQTALYHDVKLLGPDYQINDFGDTHSLVLLVDSLAVMDVLVRLDPSLQPQRLAALFGAASTSAAKTLGSSQGKAEGDTLESVVDALNLLLTGSDPRLREQPRLNEGGTWADLKPDSDLRTRFHQTLKDLKSSPILEALAGKLVIGYPTADHASLARTQFATFLALHALAPFALRAVAGAEAEVEQVLAHNWASEYADWRTDKDLTPAQRAKGEAHTSDEYLADRAALGAFLAAAGSENRSDQRLESVVQIAYDQHYDDLASKKQLSVSARPLDLSVDPREQQIRFGSPDDDTLNGGAFDDHLYGSGGADLISAGNGNDLLEGGDGSDTLRGADGQDTLRGGRGGDTLIGGKDNDSLIGGEGDDTYRIAPHDGLDWIDDQDGLGRILYGEYALGSGQMEYLTSSIWREVTPNGVLLYALYDAPDDDEGVHRLAIRYADEGLLIKRWRDGDLGIRGPEAPSAPTPAAGRTIVGDLEPIDFGPEAGIQARADDLGNLITDPDSPEPGRMDGLHDSPGNDLIQGRGGFDWLYGGRGGDDRLEGGTGSDSITGGPGADTLVGGSEADILDARAGDDQLYADEEVDIDAAIAAGREDTGSGQRGEWLKGGSGDDTLLGGTGNDALFGGIGADLLVGGPGDDVLDGDDDYRPAHFDWRITQHSYPFDSIWQPISSENVLPLAKGDDVLYGGSGNDRLYGLTGDDLLYGESGNDTMAGFSEDDALFGGDGDDSMTGDYGADEYASGAGVVAQGNDFLDGGEGDDWLQGESGEDSLEGGAGSDTLIGDATYLDGARHGRDSLAGGAGNDKLWGNGDDDLLSGEAGNDYLEGDY